MYFHIFFHPHVFSKNINNIIRTTLSNKTLIYVTTLFSIFITFSQIFFLNVDHSKGQKPHIFYMPRKAQRSSECSK